MSVPHPRFRRRAGDLRRHRGAALVIATVLLLAVTLLGITGMVTATLELQMSGNAQYRERAFQAAEFAVAQAISSGTLSTGYTLASPKRVPASGDDPPVPGSPTDTYSYLLYYDTSAGSTPVPGGSRSGPVLVAYHFIIEATGNSARGARDTHTQSFYVLGPAECGLAGAACDFASGTRRRTYWIQQGDE
jgi:hypothetical protein